MEVWKDIEGTFGLIEVSNEGRIRSLMRDDRILKTQEDKKGYLRVAVTVHGEKHTWKVHRLVANAFLENPGGLPQVNHKDGDKKNNRVENLEWVSNKENAYHAMAHGLWGNVFEASRKTNELRKKPIHSVDSVTGEVRNFQSISDAERYFGSRHISSVLKGKRSKAAGQYFYEGVV